MREAEVVGFWKRSLQRSARKGAGMTVKERTITQDEAEGYLYNNIATQEVSKHRWYTKRLIIFRYGDEILGFYHLDPLTEMQDGMDEFESDPVEVFPVVEKQVTTTVWERAS